jgi:hypothetical protein
MSEPIPFGEFQPPDVPTTEELAEMANVLPPTLEEAYAEGRADEREELLPELERLRWVEQTARVYFNHYLQDEADDIDNCVCGDEQHNRAKLLRGALKLAETVSA